MGESRFWMPVETRGYQVGSDDARPVVCFRNRAVLRSVYGCSADRMLEEPDVARLAAIDALRIRMRLGIPADQNGPKTAPKWPKMVPKQS